MGEGMANVVKNTPQRHSTAACLTNTMFQFSNDYKINTCYCGNENLELILKSWQLLQIYHRFANHLNNPHLKTEFVTTDSKLKVFQRYVFPDL